MANTIVRPAACWENTPPGFVATVLTVVALLMTPTGVVVATTFVTAFPEVVARVAPVKNDPCVAVVCTLGQSVAECRSYGRHSRARLPGDAVYDIAGGRGHVRHACRRPTGRQQRGVQARRRSRRAEENDKSSAAPQLVLHWRQIRAHRASAPRRLIPHRDIAVWLEVRATLISAARGRFVSDCCLAATNWRLGRHLKFALGARSRVINHIVTLRFGAFCCDRVVLGHSADRPSRVSGRRTRGRRWRVSDIHFRTGGAGRLANAKPLKTRVVRRGLSHALTLKSPTEKSPMTAW